MCTKHGLIWWHQIRISDLRCQPWHGVLISNNSFKSFLQSVRVLKTESSCIANTWHQILLHIFDINILDVAFSYQTTHSNPFTECPYTYNNWIVLYHQQKLGCLMDPSNLKCPDCQFNGSTNSACQTLVTQDADLACCSISTCRWVHASVDFLAQLVWSKRQQLLLLFLVTNWLSVDQASFLGGVWHASQCTREPEPFSILETFPGDRKAPAWVFGAAG